MEFFEEAINKVKDAFDVATKKTNDVVSLQKQKFDLASMQSKLSKDYETLGRLCLDTVISGADLSDEAKALAGEIVDKEEQAEKLNAEILKAKGKKFCASCGTANNAEANFCYVCGHKLAEEEAQDEEPQAEEPQTQDGPATGDAE